MLLHARIGWGHNMAKNKTVFEEEKHMYATKPISGAGYPAVPNLCKIIKPLSTFMQYPYRICLSQPLTPLIALTPL